MEKKKVLIVDDEDNVRHLLRSMLGNKYIVLEAKDGKVAMKQNPVKEMDIKYAVYLISHVIRDME